MYCKVNMFRSEGDCQLFSEENENFLKDLVVKPLLILTVEGYLVINIFVLVLMTRPLLPVVRVGFVGLDNFHREFWVFPPF